MSNSLYIKLVYESNKSDYILFKLTYLFDELILNSNLTRLINKLGSTN